MRASTFFVLVLTLVPRPADAQNGRPVPQDCGAEGGVYVWGRVQDLQSGEGLQGAQIAAPQGRCGALTNATGYYALSGFAWPTLSMVLLGYDGIVRNVDLGSDTVRIDFEARPAALGDTVIVEDYARFDIRPSPVAAPRGVPGCYWIGGGPWAETTLRLEAGGEVTPRFAEGYPGHWTLDSARVSLRIDRMWTPDAFELGIITLEATPDWGELPLRITSIQMFDRSETLTFAVRVPCPTGH